MKLILSLVFECHIPTLNEYINAERTDKYMAANIKKTLTSNISWMTVQQTKMQLVGKHDLLLTWHRKDNRADPDNIYAGIKFILDGIVAAGVLPGDGRKNIRNISHTIVPAKTNYVTIDFHKI